MKKILTLNQSTQWLFTKSILEVISISHILTFVLFLFDLINPVQFKSLFGAFLFTAVLFKLIFDVNPLEVISENTYHKIHGGRSEYQHMDTVLVILMTLTPFILASQVIRMILA